MIVSKISKKGQIVIPRTIRERLKIRAGDTIIFKIVGGKVMLEVSRERLKDILKAGKPTTQSTEFQRRMREEWTHHD